MSGFQEIKKALREQQERLRERAAADEETIQRVGPSFRGGLRRDMTLAKEIEELSAVTERLLDTIEGMRQSGDAKS